MAERKNPGIPLGCVSDGGAYLPEREKVRELRMREMGCADIAKQLDIPEGIVIASMSPEAGPSGHRTVPAGCLSRRLVWRNAAWLRQAGTEIRLEASARCAAVRCIQPG